MKLFLRCYNIGTTESGKIWLTLHILMGIAIKLIISFQNQGCKGHSKNSVIKAVLISLFYVCVIGKF